jgi:hypothetical protein
MGGRPGGLFLSKRVAIVQSSYIPWKGYFDLIRRVDEFILYDDAQFTRRDWRSRNRIKTPSGAIWLTVPVHVKGKYHQSVKDVRVSEAGWNIRHWRSIHANYAKAPYFNSYKSVLEDLYVGCDAESLSEINFRFMSKLCTLLSIDARLTWSMDYDLGDGRTDRLVAMCRQAGATEYLSGPAAREYIDPKCFEDAGIELTFMDYDGYPEYQQLYPPFDHQVSVIDLLVHTGPRVLTYMLPLRGVSRSQPTA